MPATEEGPPTTTPAERRFLIPVSPEVLRKLHGRQCVECDEPGGELVPAGEACSVATPDGGGLIEWSVRAHAACLGRLV